MPVTIVGRVLCAQAGLLEMGSHFAKDFRCAEHYFGAAYESFTPIFHCSFRDRRGASLRARFRFCR